MPKLGIGGRVRISKYDIPFKKVYKPQFLREISEIYAIATKKTSNIYNQRRTRRRYPWEPLRERIN